MQKVTRSVHNAALQTALLHGLAYSILDNSTWNQKFDIQASARPAENTLPRQKYIGIGIGGLTVTTNDGLMSIDSVGHLPTHSGLYKSVPFILRDPGNDLTAVERKGYRLRRVEYHDGKPYVAYYLRVLDTSNTAPQLEFRSVTDNVTTTTPYTSSLSDLNPTIPSLSNTGTNVTTGDYVAATAKIPFQMTSSEIVEFQNAITIIYGDAKYANISEIALCSGVDSNVLGDFNGVSASYTEAIVVQMLSSIACTYVTGSLSDGFTVNINSGAVEPMLTTTVEGG